MGTFVDTPEDKAKEKKAKKSNTSFFMGMIAGASRAEKKVEQKKKTTNEVSYGSLTLLVIAKKVL